MRPGWSPPTAPPDRLVAYAEAARGRGLKVIIAGAGGAAHLPGMAAAMTPLPVLGVPVESHALKGMDSLLSIAQMPGGIPVGTLAIGKAGAINAGLLAAAILALSDPALAGRLDAWRAAQTAGVPEPPRRRRDRRFTGRFRCRPAPPSASSAAASSAGCRRWPRRGWAIAATSSRREPDGPGMQVAAAATVAPYEDAEALAEFAAAVDVVTFEFENVPGRDPGHLAPLVPCRPGVEVLRICQDRLGRRLPRIRRRPVAPWRAVMTKRIWPRPSPRSACRRC